MVCKKNFHKIIYLEGNFGFVHKINTDTETSGSNPRLILLLGLHLTFYRLSSKMMRSFLTGK